MTWRDFLRPASFKGVPFHVEEVKESGGRRFVKHQFPLGTKVLHEDLGQGDKKFSIEAFVIGDDYITEKNAVIDALLSPGGGQLIHPYKGTLHVVCVRYNLQESVRRGGIATFTIEFEETGDIKQVEAVKDTQSDVALHSNQLLSTVKTDFNEGFNIGGLPDFAVGDARNRIADFGSKVKAFSGANGITGQAQAFLNLASDEFGVNFPLSLNDSLGLSSDVQGLFHTLVSTFPKASQRGGVMQDIASAFTPTESFNAAPTPSRIQQQSNAQALNELVYRTSLSHEVMAITEQEFTSYSEALSTRDSLVQRLDEQAVMAADNGQDETYVALLDVKGAVVKDLTERSVDLPRLMELKQERTEPALAIANRLYGDDLAAVETMAEDLVQRNQVKHPGFVVGGESLEAISDE